jgi:hypothetical protein
MPDSHEKEMEELSKAIVEAIMGSNDVKEALEKLKKIDSNTANSIMVFMVRMDSLSNTNEKCRKIDPIIEESLRLKPKKRRGRKAQEKPFIVDGRILSRNEQKFLDYLSFNFDQIAWLKKNKLKLD